MTFEEFQATGRDSDNLSSVVSDLTLIGNRGRIYIDRFYLEDCSTWWPGTKRLDKWKRGYWTIIGNSDFHSEDLEKIERMLYEFAVAEGIA